MDLISKDAYAVVVIAFNEGRIVFLEHYNYETQSDLDLVRNIYHNLLNEGFEDTRMMTIEHFSKLYVEATKALDAE